MYVLTMLQEIKYIQPPLRSRTFILLSAIKQWTFQRWLSSSYCI